jgi:N-hydroxyarylamine O-acetyltransferase
VTAFNLEISMRVMEYCSRLGLNALPPTTADGLAALQLAQRRAIPFENIDVLLGREIRIDGDAVFAKLVSDRRGGYCFEQNILLASAVTAMGIAVRPVLARVWLNADSTPPLTHMALLATLDDGEWLMAAGFGGGYCPPIRLIDGATADGLDGSSYRLCHDAQTGWMLERSHKSTAAKQFGFDLAEVFPADIALSNHWTSMHPTSRFTRHLIVNRISNDGRVSLIDQKLDRTVGTETIGSPAQLAEILEREFLLKISNEEVAIVARRIGILIT